MDIAKVQAKLNEFLDTQCIEELQALKEFGKAETDRLYRKLKYSKSPQQKVRFESSALTLRLLVEYLDEAELLVEKFEDHLK